MSRMSGVLPVSRAPRGLRMPQQRGNEWKDLSADVCSMDRINGVGDPVQQLPRLCHVACQLVPPWLETDTPVATSADMSLPSWTWFEL